MFFFTEHPESSSSEELLMGPAPYGAEQTCKLIIDVIYLQRVPWGLKPCVLVNLALAQVVI